MGIIPQPDAKEQFMAAKEAFQVLSDTQSRSTYDRQLVSMCASPYTPGAAQGLTNTEWVVPRSLAPPAALIGATPLVAAAGAVGPAAGAAAAPAARSSGSSRTSPSTGLGPSLMTWRRSGRSGDNVGRRSRSRCGRSLQTSARSLSRWVAGDAFAPFHLCACCA